MIEALALSLAIGLLRGGRLRNFARLDLRGTEWIFVGAIMQYGTLVFATRGVDFFVTYGSWVFVASFIPLMYGVWSSRRLAGMVWIGIGLLLNLVVIAANGGSMPVDPDAARRVGVLAMDEEIEREGHYRHVRMDQTTRLWFLGDIIPIPPPYPRPGVASIGDLMMVIGVFVLVQRTMVDRERRGSRFGIS